MKHTSLIASIALAATLLATPLAQATNTTLTIKYTPKLTYPIASRQAKQEGMVIIHGQVNAQGKVASVQVKQSSGFEPLDQAALKHIQQFRFHNLPAGQETAVFEQAVHFQLK